MSNKGRPTKQEMTLMEAWEESTACMGTAVELLDTLTNFLQTVARDIQNDYDQQKPVSRSRLEQVQIAQRLTDSALGKTLVALDAVRLQRSALFRQGIIFEGSHEHREED